MLWKLLLCQKSNNSRIRERTRQTFKTGQDLALSFTEAADLDEDRYWEDVYAEAQQLMDNREFESALNKFNVIRNSKPDFQDVEEKYLHLQTQIDLNCRYMEVVKMIEQAKIGAQSIIETDGMYPDNENVFKTLGIEYPEDDSIFESPFFIAAIVVGLLIVIIFFIIIIILGTSSTTGLQ